MRNFADRLFGNTNAGVLVFLCLCTITVHAQKGVFLLGLETGPSITTINESGDRTGTFRPMMGGGFGISAEYFVSPVVSIRGGAAVEQKGASMPILLTDATGLEIGTRQLRNNLEYLTIPLMVRAGFGERLRPFVNVGSYFGYMLHNNTSAPMILGLIVSNAAYDRYDFGISWGCGLQLNISEKFVVSFELRDLSGVNNINIRPTPALVNRLHTWSITAFIGASWRLNRAG